MGTVISLERRRLLAEVEERMERIAALMERRRKTRCFVERHQIDAQIRLLVDQNLKTAA